MPFHTFFVTFPQVVATNGNNLLQIVYSYQYTFYIYDAGHEGIAQFQY